MPFPSPKSPIHQYKIQITKSECQLCSPQALVAWAAVTSLKPGQAWFPRIDCHGADGAGEGVPADEPCPMDLVSLFPSQPQDAGTSSCSETMPLLPKDVQPLGWKSSEKPCGPHVSWCWSFPPPASFLRVAPPMDESTLPRVVLQELGFVQVTGVRKEEGMGHKL